MELKRVMKEATESEYAASQKLAYETAARRALEVEFEVVLKSLESDQITIAGYEVELTTSRVPPIMQCLAYQFWKKGVSSSPSLIAW
jgi:hypothetical protein